MPAVSVFSTRTEGRKVGSRWRWIAPWPQQDPLKSYQLRVYELPSQKLQLLTRLYRAGAQEIRDVAAAGEQARQWARREPGSVEPLVYLSTLLSDKGRLEESLTALNSALALRPADKGLLQMKVRLLLDLGRYRQAFEVPVPPS